MHSESVLRPGHSDKDVTCRLSSYSIVTPGNKSCPLQLLLPLVCPAASLTTTSVQISRNVFTGVAQLSRRDMTIGADTVINNILLLLFVEGIQCLVLMHCFIHRLWLFINFLSKPFRSFCNCAAGIGKDVMEKKTRLDFLIWKFICPKISSLSLLTRGQCLKGNINSQ